MKRCPKRPVEPQCLADFRGAQPSATWQDLRNEARACYDEIRAQTRADQGGLCAWCETALTTTNEQIAHFHPKSDKTGPRNWGLDWGNLWLACKGGTQAWLADLKLHPLPENRSCDEHKEDRCLDGMVLTPGEIPAFPPIFRYDRRPDGRLDLFTVTRWTLGRIAETHLRAIDFIG